MPLPALQQPSQAKEMGTYTITIDRQLEQFQDLAMIPQEINKKKAAYHLRVREWLDY